MIVKSRERPVVTRSASSPSDPQEKPAGSGRAAEPGDGNIGSDDTGLSVLSREHVQVVNRLAHLFEARGQDLDLAIMKVIAEDGSPSEWLAGMLRQSTQYMEVPPEPPRPRFLGE